MTTAPTISTLSGLGTKFLVECEIDAHDGSHRLQLVVMAPDEDDAIDGAILMLDRGRVTNVSPKS